MWVAPFGNLRVNGYLLLTAAYRSLSRPSSAPDAKAFSLRSFQLDLLEIWFSLRIMQALEILCEIVTLRLSTVSTICSRPLPAFSLSRLGFRPFGLPLIRENLTRSLSGFLCAVVEYHVMP